MEEKKSTLITDTQLPRTCNCRHWLGHEDKVNHRPIINITTREVNRYIKWHFIPGEHICLMMCHFIRCPIIRCFVPREKLSLSPWVLPSLHLYPSTLSLTQRIQCPWLLSPSSSSSSYSFAYRTLAPLGEALSISPCLCSSSPYFQARSHSQSLTFDTTVSGAVAKKSSLSSCMCAESSWSECFVWLYTVSHSHTLLPRIHLYLPYPITFIHTMNTQALGNSQICVETMNVAWREKEERKRTRTRTRNVECSAKHFFFTIACEKFATSWFCISLFALKAFVKLTKERGREVLFSSSPRLTLGE